MSTRDSIYLKLESRILRDEQGGILDRGKYGELLLDARKGRERLPKGMLADLVAAAAKAGLPVSEQEIQRRMRFAEVYTSEAHRRQVLMVMGSWSAIVNAGFPEVSIDELALDSEDLEVAGFSTQPPDEFHEQLELIPGFGATIKVRGRAIPLAEATVGEAKAYRETYRQIHENFGKTLALIDTAVNAMEDGSNGDDDANALEAWKRGTDPDVHDDQDPPL